MNFAPLLRACTACAFLTALAGTASAQTTLVGQTLTFLRAYPTPTTPYTQWNPNSQTTTVTADASDTIVWDILNFRTRIDPGANDIVITFEETSTFCGGNAGCAFDGFLITGFGRDIASFGVQSNTTGLSTTFSNTLRSAQVSFNGANVAGGALTLSVALVPVPEPAGALMALAGLAVLAGLESGRRRAVGAAGTAAVTAG